MDGGLAMGDLELFTRLLDTLRQQPVLTLFLIIGIGYLLGRVRMGSFPLGPARLATRPGS